MTGPQPQYAPGDPVLVAGEIVDAESRFGYLVETLDGGPDGPSKGARRYVRASDVHPVPPTPDPRDTAPLCGRDCHRRPYWMGADQYDPCPCVLPRHEGDDHLCRHDSSGRSVPAPPASTPTGWTAEEQAEAAAREYLLSDYIPPGEMADQPGAGPTVAFVGGYVRGYQAAAVPVPDHGPTLDETDARLVAILRAAGREWGPLGVARTAALLIRPEAGAGTAPVPAPPAPTALQEWADVVASASDSSAPLPLPPPPAPATTDDDRVEVAALALAKAQDADSCFDPLIVEDGYVSETARDEHESGAEDREWFRRGARAVLAADDAHSAAGSLPPIRSDLTGLGAREAGLTVYPATDARSADQDVTG